MSEAPELVDARAEYEARLADLEAAQATSLRLGVFSGVSDAGRWVGPPTPKPLLALSKDNPQSNAHKANNCNEPTLSKSAHKRLKQHLR